MNAFFIQMRIETIQITRKSLHSKLEKLWFHMIKWCHLKWCHPEMVTPGAGCPPSDATAAILGQEELSE